MRATHTPDAFPPLARFGSRPERALIPVSAWRLTVTDRQASVRAAYREAFGAYLGDAQDESPRAGAQVLARHALETGGSFAEFVDDVVATVNDAVRSADGPAQVA